MPKRKRVSPATPLNIGDKVLVKSLVTFGYECDPNELIDKPLDKIKWTRTAFKQECNPPIVMVVCGAHCRHLGTFVPAENYSSLDGDDCEPSHLKVTGTVFVYELRSALMRKPCESLPEDVELVSNKGQ